MRFRSLLCVSLLALAAGVGGCTGKTVVLGPPETPSGSPTTQDPSPEEPTADDPSPTSTPGPEGSPEEPEESATEDPDDPGETGWWPPAPDPSPTDEHSPSPSPTDEGEQNPQPGESETERYTFPGWDEYIYDARNGERPQEFRDRAKFSSCGDYASEAGAHLISPETAECLEEGRESAGRESAVAVRMGEGEVHVWFVRVGPEGSEYFIDRSQAGGQWWHASCDPQAPIGMLECDEPRVLPHGDEEDPGETSTDDPSGGDEGTGEDDDDGQSTDEGQDEEPSKRPEGTPAPEESPDQPRETESGAPVMEE